MADEVTLPANVVSTSRGWRTATHHVLTTANHFPSRLPGFSRTAVVKLVTPRRAPARFGQYLLQFTGAQAGPTAATDDGLEHFYYVLAGTLSIARGDHRSQLRPGGFAYLPAGVAHHARSCGESGSVLWIKRPYEPAQGVAPPDVVIGHRDDFEFRATSVPGLTRLELLDTDDPRLDFNMSLMRFEPGTVFRTVEVHDEEHGLYVTAGRGLQYLSGKFHEIECGDFVYMAPYCPQYFYSVGRESTEYLLYKDVFRDGFGALRAGAE
jgi:(S)-ureidoglycine aminohydrolase